MSWILIEREVYWHDSADARLESGKAVTHPLRAFVGGFPARASWRDRSSGEVRKDSQVTSSSYSLLNES